MTSITSGTAESAIRQPSGRLSRRTITSFLAGVVLAGTVAVGINAAAGDSSPDAATPSVGTVSHVAAAQEPGCFVLRGAC